MRRTLAAAAIGGLLFGAVPSAAQAVPVPQNWKPCHTKTSHHCTYAAQFRAGVWSWWRGERKKRHPLTERRARIKMEQGFRYHNWTSDGRVDGHPGCWDNGFVMLCYDGYRRVLGSQTKVVTIRFIR